LRGEIIIVFNISGLVESYNIKFWLLFFSQNYAMKMQKADLE